MNKYIQRSRTIRSQSEGAFIAPAVPRPAAVIAVDVAAVAIGYSSRLVRSSDGLSGRVADPMWQRACRRRLAFDQARPEGDQRGRGVWPGQAMTEQLEAEDAHAQLVDGHGGEGRRR